jgi:ABC-type sugar transport system substrate-binding protein
MPIKYKFALTLMTALCALLSSCSPPPVSGQTFVTQAGVKYPLGAVQVEVISATDADDFMTQCQAEIDAKARALNAAYNNVKTVCDTAVRVESQTR